MSDSTFLLIWLLALNVAGLVLVRSARAFFLGGRGR